MECRLSYCLYAIFRLPVASFFLCAWLDPSIITKTRELYVDVDLSHGPSYGHTLTWAEKLKPATPVRLVHAQVDVDLAKFRKTFVDLMTAPTRTGR